LIIERWDTLPAVTRAEVERRVRNAGRTESLGAWLMSLADLVEAEYPTAKRGAPRSTMRSFAETAARIWRRMGLEPGRAYDGIEDVHVDGAFQRFCNSALAIVRDAKRVSGRQVDLVKRR
jgi:hypothetical protein